MFRIFLEEFQEKIDIASKLFPLDIPILIAHLIASLFLLFCLIFLLYKPFYRWMRLRSEKEQSTLKTLNHQLSEAESKNLIAEKKLQTTQKFILNMVFEKKKLLNQERMKILKEANQTKKNILINTDAQIQERLKNAEDDFKKAIVINAVNLTEKLLKRKIDPKEHQKMIDDFIKKIDA